MARVLDIEKVRQEVGPFTQDALRVLWNITQALQQTFRTGIRRATDMLEPRVAEEAPSAAVDDYYTNDSSVLHFTGSTSVNLTGIQAPETGMTRVLILHVTGSGTITLKNESSSSSATNRIVTISGGDAALATGASAILIYLADRYRQVV